LLGRDVYDSRSDTLDGFDDRRATGNGRVCGERRKRGDQSENEYPVHVDRVPDVPADVNMLAGRLKLKAESGMLKARPIPDLA
jgi:hypothetical protein